MTHDKVNEAKHNRPPHLESQLARVAENQRRHLPSDWFNLLECCEGKHCRFSHSRLRLAYQVLAKNRLWDRFVLHCEVVTWRQNQQQEAIHKTMKIRVYGGRRLDQGVSHDI